MVFQDFSVKPFLPWFSPKSECYLDYYLRFRGESVLVVPRETETLFFVKADQAPEVWLRHQWRLFKLTQLEDLDVIRAAKAEIRHAQDQDGVLKASSIAVSVMMRPSAGEETEQYLNNHKIRFTRLV